MGKNASKNCQNLWQFYYPVNNEVIKFTLYCEKRSTATITIPTAKHVTITAAVFFINLYLSGQMIFFHSAFKPFILFLIILSTSLILMILVMIHRLACHQAVLLPYLLSKYSAVLHHPHIPLTFCSFQPYRSCVAENKSRKIPLLHK